MWIYIHFCFSLTVNHVIIDHSHSIKFLFGFSLIKLITVTDSIYCIWIEIIIQFTITTQNVLTLPHTFVSTSNFHLLIVWRCKYWWCTNKLQAREKKIFFFAKCALAVKNFENYACECMKKQKLWTFKLYTPRFAYTGNLHGYAAGN